MVRRTVKRLSVRPRRLPAPARSRGPWCSRGWCDRGGDQLRIWVRQPDRQHLVERSGRSHRHVVL